MTNATTPDLAAKLVPVSQNRPVPLPGEEGYLGLLAAAEREDGATDAADLDADEIDRLAELARDPGHHVTAARIGEEGFRRFALDLRSLGVLTEDELSRWLELDAALLRGAV
jgi:hypothetical protein